MIEGYDDNELFSTHRQHEMATHAALQKPQVELSRLQLQL